MIEELTIALGAYGKYGPVYLQGRYIFTRLKKLVLFDEIHCLANHINDSLWKDNGS